MAGETLGTIRGQMILDVKQALAAYTQARQAHISTVTALHTGAGAMTAAGAGVAAVGAAMVAGFGVAIGAAAEFEKRLDYFGAVSASTQQEYDAIREKALQLGTDTIYSANQIAESFIELGKSGVSAKDIIDGIGEGVANLGAAADIPLDTAANIITSAVATFQLGADQAVMVADKLAGAANASILDVEDLGTSLKYVGGVAASLGVPFQDVNTALGILGENGIKGSTAGTSLRQILLGLNGSTKKATKALTSLGIITADGTNQFYNMDGSAKSLSEVFQILQDATAGMGDAQKTAVMQQIFATRALPSLIALTREGAAGFEEMAAAIDKTTALDVASARLDNLSGDIEILRGNIDTLLIESGSGFQTFARFVVQSITSIVQAFIDLPAPIQTAMAAITASTGGLLIIIGGLGLLAGSVMNIIALGIQMKPVWIALGSIFTKVGAAILVASRFLAATPLGIVITLVVALVSALIILYNTSETFRAAVGGIFDALVGVFQSLQPVITTVVGALASFFATIATGAAGGLTTVVSFLGQMAAVLGGILSSALQAILPPLLSLVSTFMSGLMPVLTAVMPLLQAIGAIFAALFSGNLTALPGLIQNFATAFQGVVSAIATEFLPMIIQMLTDLVVNIIGILPTLVTAGVGIVQALILGLAQAIPMIVTAAVQLVTGLITTIIGMVPMLISTGLQLILGLVTALATMLPQIIQAGISLVMGLIQGIITIIPILINTVVTIIPVLITAIVTMIPLLIEAAIQLFLALVTGLLGALPQIITAVIDGILQIVTSLLSMLPTLITAAIQLFLGLITGLLQALPQIIVAVVQAIPQIITALVGTIPLIIEAAISLFTGLITGLSSALPQIIEAVIAAVPQIVTALVEAAPLLWDAGVQLIQGLIDGVLSMGSALWDAATDLAQSAVDAVTGLFQEHSPSKVAFGIGSYFTEGLIDGIWSLQNEAVQTATALADSIASVPFEMTGMQAMYDQMNTAKAMQMEMSTSLAGVGTAQLSAHYESDQEPPTLVNVETLEINNPESEPASESLPRAIRSAAYTLT